MMLSRRKAKAIVTADPVRPPREQRVAQALSSFRSIVGRSKRQLIDVRRQCDISGAQLWALSQVGSAPGLTVMELAGRLSVHQSTTSNLIERLESAGYLRRKRDAGDGRIVRLFCTAAGLRLLKRVPVPVRGILPQVIERLSDDELSLLEAALALLSRELGDLAQRGGRRPLSNILP